MAARLLLALLAAAVLVLAAATVHVATMAIETSPLATTGGPVAPAASNASAGWVEPLAVSAADAVETRARPLFQPDRRPYRAAVTPPPGVQVARPPIAPPAPPPPKPPEGLKLMGIVGEVGGSRRALVATTAVPAGVWLARDGTIEGWRVTDIDDASVVIERQGVRHEVELFPRAGRR